MKKVMLAMSGGVDSSAALLFLKDKYDLSGVTLKLFESQADLENKRSCCTASDAADAKIAASRFNIPHYVYNFTDVFREQVIDRFAESYLNGETPNPCVDCNKYVKFEALLTRAEQLGCDYLATGHYARVEFDEKLNRYLLKKAVCKDPDGNMVVNPKDQSYVLYDLTQKQLAKILFPLGSSDKVSVREDAKKHGLANYGKPDSQDVCFVQDGNYADFIYKHTGKAPEKGTFLDESQKTIGQHDGLLNYTLGQRRGLKISRGERMYVAEKNLRDNTVTLCKAGSPLLYCDSFTVGKANWIAFDRLDKPLTCTVQTRYRGIEHVCTVTPLYGDEVLVEFASPVKIVSPGQRAVFYQEDTVIGGGSVAPAA